MIFMLRTRAWVPGRAVPWCLGRLPWAPGAPPRGGSRPKLQGPIPTTSTCRPIKSASKFRSILISFFCRFGVDLGSFLGVMFDHVGAFFGPSWSRNRLRINLSSKKIFFTKPYVFHLFLAQIDPKMGPRSTQDRSKMGPRSSWVAFFSS